MRSYRLEKFAQPFVEVKAPAPAPTGHQVVVDVKACGLCHSDVHLHDGYFDLGDGAKVDATRIVNPPRTLGHEIVGTVSGLGPDAKGVKISDKRVVFPWIGCGKCNLCAAGNEHLCNTPQALARSLPCLSRKLRPPIHSPRPPPSRMTSRPGSSFASHREGSAASRSIR